MSQGARTRRRPQSDAPRRTFTVYTWMLILAFLFISVACGLLVLELTKYGKIIGAWKTTEAQLSQAAPSPVIDRYIV